MTKKMKNKHLEHFNLDKDMIARAEQIADEHFSGNKSELYRVAIKELLESYKEVNDA